MLTINKWIRYLIDCWSSVHNFVYACTSLQNKCWTTEPDQKSLGRSGKLSLFIIYKFWQNCASYIVQVSDLTLETAVVIITHFYDIQGWSPKWTWHKNIGWDSLLHWCWNKMAVMLMWFPVWQPLYFYISLTFVPKGPINNKHLI